MLLITIVAFLGGVLSGLSYHASKSYRRDEELRQARELAEFWHEHCNNWHALAVANGAGQRKAVPVKTGIQRITVPDPPQAEIVAAGRTGIHVWRN